LAASHFATYVIMHGVAVKQTRPEE